MKHAEELKARTVNFRMTDEELERLDSLAKLEDRSRSQLLRRFVMAGLDRAVPAKRVMNA